MKKFISDFDIKQVEFEERYENEEYETMTLYFIAPKEWLGDAFPDATHSEISVEYPINHPEPAYEYRGPVKSTYTAIVRMNFRWSVPALRRRIMRSRSIGPIMSSFL